MVFGSGGQPRESATGGPFGLARETFNTIFAGFDDYGCSTDL